MALNVNITSNLSEFPCERRYDPQIKIGDLKQKLEMVTGANHKTMELEVYVDEKLVVSKLDNDDKSLGDYLNENCKSEDGSWKMEWNCSNVRLNITDNSTSKDEFTDTSKVEKFTIKDEEYEKRPNVRNFIKELRSKSGNENDSGAVVDGDTPTTDDAVKNGSS